MTRPATPQPRSAELDAIAVDVEAALREGRFDEAFFQDARNRVADAHGGFNDNYRVLIAAAKAGLIPSPLSALNLTPTAQWDPAARAFIPI